MRYNSTSAVAQHGGVRVQCRFEAVGRACSVSHRLLMPHPFLGWLPHLLELWRPSLDPQHPVSRRGSTRRNAGEGLRPGLKWYTSPLPTFHWQKWTTLRNVVWRYEPKEEGKGGHSWAQAVPDTESIWVWEGRSQWQNTMWPSVWPLFLWASFGFVFIDTYIKNKNKIKK